MLTPHHHDTSPRSRVSSFEYMQLGESNLRSKQDNQNIQIKFLKISILLQFVDTKMTALIVKYNFLLNRYAFLYKHLFSEALAFISK